MFGARNKVSSTSDNSYNFISGNIMRSRFQQLDLDWIYWPLSPQRRDRFNCSECVRVPWAFFFLFFFFFNNGLQRNYDLTTATLTRSLFTWRINVASSNPALSSCTARARQQRYLAAPMNRINIQVNTRDSLEIVWTWRGRGYTF